MTELGDQISKMEQEEHDLAKKRAAAFDQEDEDDSFENK